jgi:glutamate/aspartate transport system permease protein
MREFSFQIFEAYTGAMIIYIMFSALALFAANWIEKATAVPGFIAAGSANTGGH